MVFSINLRKFEVPLMASVTSFQAVLSYAHGASSKFKHAITFLRGKSACTAMHEVLLGLF